MTTENQIPKIVFVGTFPPTDEGIATFNFDTVTAVQKLLGASANCSIAAINLANTSPYYFNHSVIAEIDQESLALYENAAQVITSDSSVQCVVVQHEYGIFGGEWGEYIGKFYEMLDVPIVTIMHSVLRSSDYKQSKFKEVTDKIVERSDAIVVLSRNSKQILKEMYGIDDKVFFIPHGIHPVNFILPQKIKRELNLSNKTVLTTFGLLSESKGIEHVLRCLPAVINKHPDVLYQVLGQTHPIVRRREGEKYRNTLVSLVKELGIRKNVRFIDKYLDLAELLKYLKGTDLYIATSVNKDQAVSGTFSYAVGTGRAVVSTDFIQAKEVVTDSMGKLVPPKDEKAYAQAINSVLSDRKKLKKRHRYAYSKTRSMLWTNVAKKVINVIGKVSKNEQILLPPYNLTYLKSMTKKYGILQFAKYSIPLAEHGYTIDDNARALIFMGWAHNESINGRKLNLLRKYFNFVKKARNPDKVFVNYYDTHFKPTEQNEHENPIEHYGRAMWAIAETLANDSLPIRLRNEAIKIWNESFDTVDNYHNHLRPRAFIVKAMAVANAGLRDGEEIRIKLIKHHADKLVASFESNSKKSWMWFEDTLSYNNAILPESLALAYKLTGDKVYLNVARKAFSFLMRKSFMGEIFSPVGQSTWYKRGKKRSYYDQQPEEAASQVLGLITMYEVTKRAKYINYAKNAFSWFLGNNLNGLPLYNFKTGGVFDGLTKEGVNKNQGAESLLSYLLARIKIEKYY